MGNKISFFDFFRCFLQRSLIMKICFPAAWNELNDWQLEQLAFLWFNPKKANTFAATYLNMLEVLFRKKEGVCSWLRWQCLLRRVPVSRLRAYGNFLLEMPKCYRFPEVRIKGKKLVKPGDRLGDISIEQFSAADALFFRWRTTQDDIHLKQLAASLYTLDGKFSPFQLPAVAQYTDCLRPSQRYFIGMVFMSIHQYIRQRYPKIFPPPVKEKSLRPVFKNKENYTPFAKIIRAMAMEERQPLGGLKDCKHTRLYDFMNMLEESILRYEKMEKFYEK